MNPGLFALLATIVVLCVILIAQLVVLVVHWLD